ncbi:MAG TPA: ABC transporter substrate-binding protein, partial [Euzebya sp.]|nr:ABC transporter substrate-binding protein [Euzebya sp.]
MSKKLLIALFLALAMIAVACGGDDGDDAAGEDDTEEADAGDAADDGDDGSTAGGADFTLFGAPTGVEGNALSGFIDVYNEETGSNITFTGSDDFETQLQIRVDGGDPPAVAFTPQPGSICQLADDGELVSLEDMGFDVAAMEENHSEFWMNLGLCEDGNHYGIPWFPNFKSIVFYHQPTFEEQGYEVPETYEDMVALSQQIVDDGMTPWCFGFESGGATGWPGTDWIEDIYVRQHGADMYTQWFQHGIPFDDPSVVQSFETFSEIFHGEGFVLGGPENVVGVNFNDSPGPLFSDPPGCLMLKQGSFITNVFADQPEYDDGEESEIDVFTFPTIDGNPGALGGGDTLIVFDDAPENVQAVMDWITPEWQCVLASASGGGVSEFGGHGVEGVERLPGHKDVNLDCYESDQARTFAEAITTALSEQTFVFDASDLMPPAVGQGSFWEGMVDFVTGAPIDQIVSDIEASWPE